jgi:hypothetical protein
MDQEIVSLKDRTNFLINHGMKTGFKFKHIYDFSEEMEKIRKYIEKNGLEYNNKISKSRYSKTHGSVEQIKIISIENNKQIDEPYTVFNNRVDPELLDLCMPIVKKLEEIYNGRVCECLINRLDAFSVISKHSDTEGYIELGELALGYYYRVIRRIHIPIITNDKVLFEVDGERISFKNGECWETNTDLEHAVYNYSPEPRYHLVFDVLPNKWL